MQAGDNLGYVAGTLDVAQMLSGVPGLSDAAHSLVTEQVANLDSKDMSLRVWQRLAQRCDHWLREPQAQGIVITHGTDTLEETAYFLQQVLPAALMARKPVVLTCAMRPATSAHPDGPQNILDAITLAQDARAQGVLVVCAGRIHSALQVQKVHPYRLDAFDSGEAGPMGLIEEARVRWLNVAATSSPGPAAHAIEAAALAPGNSAIEKLTALAVWPRVEIVFSHALADGLIVDALLAHPGRAEDGGTLSGIVVAGTGNGSVHRELEAALLRAQQAGIRVVRATRCPYGSVLRTETAALPDFTRLSPVKARVALLLELAGLRDGGFSHSEMAA